MSQGERGRALIARALISQVDLLLLDEPATGLDIAAREELLATLSSLMGRQPELSSVTVTHHVEEIPRHVTHVALMAGGKIVAEGTAQEIVARFGQGDLEEVFVKLAREK